MHHWRHPTWWKHWRPLCHPFLRSVMRLLLCRWGFLLGSLHGQFLGRWRGWCLGSFLLLFWRWRRLWFLLGFFFLGGNGRLSAADRAVVLHVICHVQVLFLRHALAFCMDPLGTFVALDHRNVVPGPVYPLADRTVRPLRKQPSASAAQGWVLAPPPCHFLISTAPADFRLFASACRQFLGLRRGRRLLPPFALGSTPSNGRESPGRFFVLIHVLKSSFQGHRPQQLEGIHWRFSLSSCV
mmetsp:Transcript_10172/g.61988  ORF Transcript_10172/g.61988 Transcript_10172/m.61988 type:complete len:240 (-) Transcript_10172:1555-2274(-)